MRFGVGLLLKRDLVCRRARSSALRGLTLPSRGRPQAGFAHLRPPLMSNVRPPNTTPTMQDLELRKRRIRVVATFIALVVVGYLLFHLSPEKSSLKGVGVAFMIAWLPGVAWFTVWFARKRAPLVRVPPGFARNA